MRSYLLVLTLSFFALTACKKDALRNISNGTYVTKDSAIFVPAAMYVQGAVITDQGIIQGYLYRRFTTQAPSLASSITINGNTAIDDNSHLEYNITHRYDNNFLLTAKDSVSVFSADAGTLGCGNVHNRIRQNPPDYICIDLPISGGAYIRCTGQPKIPLIANGDHLKIPLLRYYFSATRFTSSCGANSMLTDYFSSSSIGDIAANDTLVVQTGYITLTKK